MIPSKDTMCHRTFFRKSCFDLVTSGKCKRWHNIQGEHPQTGAIVNHWDCVDNLVPWTILQLGRAQGEAAASADKVATEVKAAAAVHAQAATEVAASHARLGYDIRQLQMFPGDELSRLVTTVGAVLGADTPKMIENAS